MERESVTEIYDEGYAGAYDQRFLLDAWPKHGAEFEFGIIKANIADGGRWLDVGCGTGWFLSRLPEVTRAGFDLSPAMVAQARDANPDALFIEQRSFLDDNPEWHGQWDLVTCTWQPYNYVDDVSQVERLVDNMAAWTRPGGAVFIPIVDLEDIRPHVDLPYDYEPDVWGGNIALTSITWTWNEPLTGKIHTHLVAPQAGHFAQQLATTFRKVEILRYPPFEKGGVARKAVLATNRRAEDDDGAEAEVIWHARPAHPDDLAERLAVADAEMRTYMAELEERAEAVQREADEAEAERQQELEAAQLAAELEDNQRRWAENNHQWAENNQRWAESAQAWEKAQAEARAETERANAADAEVARLTKELERATAAAAVPAAAKLATVPTKTLVRSTAGRFRPSHRIQQVRRRLGRIKRRLKRLVRR